MARRTRAKPGPKPGFMPAVNLRRHKPNPKDEAFVEYVRKDPIRGCKDLATMSHAQLRLVARGLHLPQHNIDDLSELKLRQNCQMTVASVIEALTGD